jgi:hypothetical protein
MFIRFTCVFPGVWATRVNMVNVVNLFRRISGGATRCGCWSSTRVTVAAWWPHPMFPGNFPDEAVNFPAASQQARFSSPQG